MKKVFILLFLTVSIIFQLNCKSTSSENSNSTLSNGTNTSNQSQETTVPTFTDADAALAEGKRLLDEDETEKSIEAFKQAVKLNPNLAEAYFNMGIAYALLEDEQPDTETSTEESSTSTKK